MSERLGPDWVLVTREPTKLVLEKHRGVELRRALRLFVVMLGSLLAGLALVFATPPDLEVATFPVAGLLGLVSLLGLASGVRSLVLGTRGVQLVFTPTTVTGTLAPRGLLHDLRGMAVSVPVEQVQAVRLLRVPHPGLTLSLFEVLLADGRALQGPEVASTPGAVDPLEAVARAAAGVMNRPMSLK
jgi:hypothetical protein